MKKFTCSLSLFLLCYVAIAQQGLKNIIVERYYVSNAADEAGSVGTLPVGSVTYRIFAAMLPGYKFEAAFGNGTHSLFISTSTSFFNNEDWGATTPAYTKTQAANNTVMLDSWLSAGAACAGNFGILKTADNGVGTVMNANGILKNADPLAGIPLTTQDGLISVSGETPGSVTFVGLSGSDLEVFNATSQYGNSFKTTNGAWACLAGAMGPDSTTNTVLIGQFTTNGLLSFQLNIQVGTPDGGTQVYTAMPAGTDTVMLPALTYPLNKLPSVRITSPSGGASFITGDPVSITATALDTDGTVSKVEFFINSISLGVDSASPYHINWTSITGTDTLTAIATDNQGGKTTSSPVEIHVVNNIPPTISITSPSSGSSYVTGDTIIIAADAVDTDGTVAKVQFYMDTVLIGTETIFPYTLKYVANGIGFHHLMALATDNRNAQTTSSPISITIANIPPTVSITSPVNNSNFITGQVVSIEALAADVDGTVASVEFFVNGNSVGIDSTAPYEYNWIGIAGAASITAVATDNNGAKTTSVFISITVRNSGANPFIPGNLVVYRVGDGNNFLVNTGNPVFIDEYTTGGNLVQSIALPTVDSGINHALVASGTGSSEGFMSRAADGHSLLLTGYDGLGSTSLPGTSSASKNRVVGKIDPFGNINTTTALTDFADGNNPRTVTSTDGTNLWVGGATGGIRYTTLSSTTSTQVSSVVSGIRQINIFNGQLYISTNQGSSVRIASVGTGTPDISGQPITSLAGLSTNTGSPVGFFFADLNPAVPGMDILYIADEEGTVSKYSLVNNRWTANGSVVVAAARGLVGSVNGNSVSLYVSTGSGSPVGGGTIYTLTDSTGYNSAISATVSAIVTAASMTAFRGIAFAPVPCDPVSIISQPVSPGAICDHAGLAVFNVTISGSGPFTYQWQENSVDIQNGGVYSGANDSTLTLTNPTVSLNGNKYRCVITNCYGGNIIYTDNSAVLTVNASSPVSITPSVTAPICEGDSVILTATVGMSIYSWSDGETSQSVIVKASGSYSVDVINQSGCTSSSPVADVTVNALPASVITTVGDTTFCPGGSVMLIASAGTDYSYIWSNSATTQILTAITGGQYSVTVKDTNNCTALSSPLNVNIYTLPTDINKDGITNVQDFLLLNGLFGTSCNQCPEDVNKDGIVNIYDFLLLLADFNRPCSR